MDDPAKAVKVAALPPSTVDPVVKLSAVAPPAAVTAAAAVFPMPPFNRTPAFVPPAVLATELANKLLGVI